MKTEDVDKVYRENVEHLLQESEELRTLKEILKALYLILEEMQGLDRV